MTRALALVLLALAACEPTPPTCSQVAAHVYRLFQPADAYSRDIEAAFLGRCVTDAWSAEVRACLASTRSLDEPRSCRAKLAPEQAAALDKELAAAERRESWRALPDACLAYEVQLAKAMTCEAIPRAERDRLQARLVESKAQWQAMDDKRGLEPVCTGAIAALTQVTAPCR